MSEKSKRNQEDERKILFLGLDNAGKTSISLALRGESRIDRFFNLEPTEDYKVEQMSLGNVDILLWDLGGQKFYRQDHVRKFKERVQYTDKIMFVIDVQDRERYDVALDYFETLLNALKKTKERPEIVLMLHKFDKGLEQNTIYSRKRLKQDVIDPFRQMVPENCELSIYKTVISAQFTKVDF